MTPIQFSAQKRPIQGSLLLLTALILSACAGLSDPRLTVAEPVFDIAPVDNPGAATPEGVTHADDPVKIHLGTGELIKTPIPPARPAGAANTSLNFEGADVREIAKTVLGEILKESYIVDPKVQGTISFRTVRPLPKESLLPTLETVLRMNGVVLVKENGIFKILPATGIKGSLSPMLAGSGVGFSQQVIPLQFVGAKEMAKILENVAADPALIKVDELRNFVILAGTQNEIQHMMDTIDMFDVDWLSGMSFGLFPLRSADVKTIDQEINKIFGDKASNNPLAGVVRLIPLERLNAFVIITTQPKYLEHAKIWLERLDRAGGSAGVRLHVYHVQNGKADHLANLLNQTFGGQGAGAQKQPSAPTVAPGLTGAEVGAGLSARPSATPNTTPATQIAATKPTTPQQVTGSTFSISDDAGGSADQVRVVADQESNSLLILANAAGFDKVEAALKRLDLAPRQVLIEMTIAEVTLKDELKYGIEWLFTNGPNRGGKLDLGTEGFAANVPGFSYAVSSAIGGNIKGMLNMLASDNKLNILSSPHIMVADNQTAKFQVGDSVPVAGPQTLTGTGAVVSSVQYLDTGVILSVTPRINAGGLVSLDIAQEVSTATSTTTSGLNSPTISKRSAKTAVNVQSGETMVLGGLISERTDNANVGIPFLSSIPLLGGLFGTQARNANRTELVVMITPRVANNFNQAKTLSDELRQKMGDAKDLIDCGTRNVFGYTTRRGLWCLSAGDGN